MLVTQSQVRLYYKNATADVVGKEHGITEKQLRKLLAELPKKIKQLRSFPEIREKDDAYRKLPHDTETAQHVKELVKKLKPGCKNLVVLGIGGSALGNIALQTALNPYMYNLDAGQRPGPRLFVLDNIDPAQLSSFLDWLTDNEKLDKTMFNVISKTGTASETMAQFMIVRQGLRKKFGLEGYRKRVVVTTDLQKGPLRAIITHDGLPYSLEIPDGVGGRFSVLSAAGLFTAAMCGIDIDALLAGARDMDARVGCEDFFKNPAAIIAAISYYFYNQGKKISVMMPYSYHLKDLADWYRQLWAESLGKAKNIDGYNVHIGPTPVKALGATDQHSQLQLYLEGPNDKLFTFLQVKSFSRDLKIGPVPDCAPELDYLTGMNLSGLFNNEKIATEYALLQSKRPCLTVIFPVVSPYTVGQFIYLYEVTTSFAGAFFGIDPYNQPSVKLIRDAIPELQGRAGTKNKVRTKQIRSLTKVDKKFLA
jgi:glucose-6-phosphate isomerase